MTQLLSPVVPLDALIVEDDIASRKALLQILSLQGLGASAVSNLAQARQALAEMPRALILDLMLPDGNGIEILREVRAARLPIRVAVLSGADRPMIAEAELLQPDAVFTKPVELTKLLQWLKAV